MLHFEMVEQKECTDIMQSGKNCAMNCTIQGVRLIWKQRFDWPSVSFSFVTFLSINLISSFCTQFQLSALISSFCTQKIASFCTVWDSLTCSQPISMEKFFHVYYYYQNKFLLKRPCTTTESTRFSHRITACANQHHFSGEGWGTWYCGVNTRQDHGGSFGHFQSAKRLSYHKHE